MLEIGNQSTASGTTGVDLVIRHGRLMDASPVDIAVNGGRITEIGPELAISGRKEIDAEHRLVVPAFVNPHLHLDKALTVSQEAVSTWREGTFQESIDMTLRMRERYTHDDLLARGRAVLHEAILYGTTALRVFADVGKIGGLLPARALVALKAEFASRLDLQVVAFPQEGLLRESGGRELIEDAMRAGCDVVGAFPWYELNNVYAEEHLEIAFGIAKEFDADVHAFVDDEPVAPHTRDLEALARATIAHGWEGRVAASHACGLASYDEHSAAKTMRLVAAAGISIVSNAHISLVTKCQQAPEPKPRGITRVAELIRRGVNVAAGQDDIADPYYPFGRGDQLEVAGYLAHVAHLYRPADVRSVIDAVTVNAARVMRLHDYGLAPGRFADFNVFDRGSTATDLVRLQPPRRWVVRRGRVVAETMTVRHLTDTASEPQGEAGVSIQHA